MNIPKDMNLELINYDTFEGHSFLTIKYDYKDTFGSLHVVDMNDEKSLCVDTDNVSTTYEQEVCDVINILVKGKTVDEARLVIEKINSR